MLAIYICDDIKELVECFEKHINNYLLMRDNDAAVVCATTAPESILDTVSQQPASNFGLYFLDIDLKTSMDGFQLATRIRELDPNGYIVFITEHSERSTETFQYHLEAMDYISKSTPSELQNRILNCLTLAYERYRSFASDPSRYFLVNSDTRELFLPIDNIIYFATSTTPHQIRIILEKDVLSVRGSLRTAEELMDERFFRFDKSCLVNISHISFIDKRRHLLYLDNLECLPVSSRALGRLNKKYPKFFIPSDNS